MSTKRSRPIFFGAALAIAVAMSSAWAQGGGAPASSKAQTEHKTRVVQTHRHSNRIQDVQRMLNQHGASLKVDGQLGPSTRAAVKKFQTDNGMKATGRLDKSTLDKLGVK